MIEVHLLRYALAAAETGSFSQAAERFRIKQSTLSKRIRLLEMRLGVPLFTRSTQGVAPTAGGQRLLARARSIVGDLDALSLDAGGLARGDHGSLRIGFQGSLAAGNLRATLDEFRREASQVEVEAVEAGRQRLLDSLERGDLDVAIVTGEGSHVRHRSISLWSEPLTVGLPHGHRLLERTPLCWTDLRGLRLVVTREDPGSTIARLIAARLGGMHCAPLIIPQRVSRDNLHSLVTEDQLSITSGTVNAPSPDLVFREIHDAFGATRIEQHLHWRDANASPALARFLAVAMRRYGRPYTDLLLPTGVGRAAT